MKRVMALLVLILLASILLATNVFAYADLARGSKGDEVVVLQQALINQGYLNGLADGDYGKMTEAAVYAFQKANGLPETGIADTVTQSAILNGKEAEETFTPYTHGDIITLDLQKDGGLFSKYILDENALSPENVCQTTAFLVEGALNSQKGEYIASVTLDDSILFITLHLPEEAAAPLPYEMFVEGRIDSVTDILLDYPIIDMYCNTVVLPLDGHEGGFIFTRSDISGNNIGRYMDYDTIIDQIANIDKPFPSQIPNVATEDYVKLRDETLTVQDVLGTGLSVDNMDLEFGKLLDVTENAIDKILIIKAKISPSFSNEATINQNYYNIEYLVENYDLSHFDEIQYWAVADMTDGSEGKVISFTVPHSLIEKIAGGRFPSIMMGDYVEDLWVLPSLLK